MSVALAWLGGRPFLIPYQLINALPVFNPFTTGKCNASKRASGVYEKVLTGFIPAGFHTGRTAGNCLAVLRMDVFQFGVVKTHDAPRFWYGRTAHRGHPVAVHLVTALVSIQTHSKHLALMAALRLLPAKAVLKTFSFDGASSDMNLSTRALLRSKIGSSWRFFDILTDNPLRQRS